MQSKYAFTAGLKRFQAKIARTMLSTITGSKRKIDFSGEARGPRNPLMNGVVHGKFAGRLGFRSFCSMAPIVTYVVVQLPKRQNWYRRSKKRKRAYTGSAHQRYSTNLVQNWCSSACSNTSTSSRKMPPNIR